jgi:ATP-dependent helicase/nuclease subunit B
VERAAPLAYNEEMFHPSSATAEKQRVAWTEQTLLDTLQANVASAVVVTSTVRAARALRHQYDRRQLAAGNSGWMTPHILAWEPWVGALWDAAILSGCETRVLLTELQELELWHKLLEHDEAASQTISIDALAPSAQRAWKQLHQYEIPLTRLRSDDSVDAKAFYTWAAEFQKLCRKDFFLSPALLETAIVHSSGFSNLPIPEQLFLVGFDRVTPAQMSLIDAITGHGCSALFVDLHACDNIATNRTIVCAGTADREIESAARWIRGMLMENPAQRIGIVVPSLETMQGVIDRTFRRVLAPSSMDVRVENASLSYEFSLGIPMHRLQPIRTALTLLRWLQTAISAEDVSWLLVHGGFSGAPLFATSSGSQRARLDRQFRDREFQLGGRVPFSSFQRWAARPGNQDQGVEVHRTLERIAITAQRHGMDKRRSFSEWSEIIHDLLTTAEWHLLASGSSADYQLHRRWDSLLQDLSTLDSVTGPVQFSIALAKIVHLAAHMLFTLETSNAPVQILGISESAGLAFDAVWWMNAGADAWPSHGKALPFLPWTLQRETQMPYANPDADHAFALRTTNRILNSGQTSIVSFALEKTDPANSSSANPDRETLLSSLVREVLPNLPILATEELAGMNPDAATIAAETFLETISEESAVPFQGTQVRGGIRFLELHAACPFRAFAELRLGTRPLAEPQTGLSPGAQGTIVHHVLERFWLEMKSQKNLLATPPEQLRERLIQHIHDALSEFFKHASEPWQEGLLQIEAERLERRLLAWLEQEKQRADFTVITTEDELESPELGGIEFKCRVDRLDRVDQGIVLVDYKTGVVERASCDGERPDQPQLPAYAVLRSHASEEPLAGVAFAALNPRKVGFTVVGSLPAVFSPSTSDPNAATPPRSKWNPAELTATEMELLQESWRTTLTRLANDFRDGVAIVDPKKHGQTCAYCEQSLLCRIRESSQTLESAADELDAGYHL